MEKVSTDDKVVGTAITEALKKLGKDEKEPKKEGVDLISITKKLSFKKFGKKK